VGVPDQEQREPDIRGVSRATIAANLASAAVRPSSLPTPYKTPPPHRRVATRLGRAGPTSVEPPRRLDTWSEPGCTAEYLIKVELISICCFLGCVAVRGPGVGRVGVFRVLGWWAVGG